MTISKIAAAVLCAASLAQPAFPQEATESGVTGFQSAGDLLRKCRENSTFGRSYCFAYLAAVADTAKAYRVWLGPVDPCLPPGISLGRLADLFEEYLVDNPSLTDSQAASVIVASLQYHFPCDTQEDGDVPDQEVTD